MEQHHVAVPFDMDQQPEERSEERRDDGGKPDIPTYASDRPAQPGGLYGDRYIRNQPIELEDPHPVACRLDSSTGNAGLDGYTRLAQADRTTGVRPRVGGVPALKHAHDYQE